MRYRFVIEGESTDAPPDHLQKLEKILRREVRLALGPGYEVVLAEPIDWCRECTNPFDSDEGCDRCAHMKPVDS